MRYVSMTVGIFLLSVYTNFNIISLFCQQEATFLGTAIDKRNIFCYNGTYIMLRRKQQLNLEESMDDGAGCCNPNFVNVNII